MTALAKTKDPEGQLHEWGTRLFYGRIKGKRDPNSTAAAIALWSSLSAMPLREKIAATVSGNAKQVMVKITGGGRGMKAIQAHMRYISRLGKEEAGGKGKTIELEDENGQTIQGAPGIQGLAQDWRLAGAYIPDDSRRREAYNIILSMPEGTPPEAVRDSARAFAHETFEGHKWVMVLHTDTKSPHVHLAVRAERWDGKRLNPRKPDLQRWREGFARQLQDRGINAIATPARARGVNRAPQTIWHTKAPGRVRSPRPSMRQGRGHQSSQQATTEAWRAIREVLAKSKQLSDRQLASEIAAYVDQAFTKSAERKPGRDRGRS